jgi:hypothetical protein
VFEVLLAAGVFDENPPHGFGGGHEEVVPAVPIAALGFHQTDVGLVHQSRRLEGLAGRLL